MNFIFPVFFFIYSESGRVSLPGATESSDGMERLSCVRMIIWLAVYHQLYNQKVRTHWHFPPLVNLHSCRYRSNQIKFGVLICLKSILVFVAQFLPLFTSRLYRKPTERAEIGLGLVPSDLSMNCSELAWEVK